MSKTANFRVNVETVAQLRHLAVELQLFVSSGPNAYKMGGFNALLDLLSRAYQHNPKEVEATLHAMLYCEHCLMPKHECVLKSHMCKTGTNSGAIIV